MSGIPLPWFRSRRCTRFNFTGPCPGAGLSNLPWVEVSGAGVGASTIVTGQCRRVLLLAGRIEAADTKAREIDVAVRDALAHAFEWASEILQLRRAELESGSCS